MAPMNRIDGSIWKVLCSAVLLLAAGCGTTVSEIVPAGRDTFFVSGHGYSKKAPEAMTALYKEANVYCATQGKMFVPVTSAGEQFDFSSSSVNLHFRCLAENDPEYVRPALRPAPDTVVEVNKAQ